MLHELYEIVQPSPGVYGSKTSKIPHRFNYQSRQLSTIMYHHYDDYDYHHHYEYYDYDYDFDYYICYEDCDDDYYYLLQYHHCYYSSSSSCRCWYGRCRSQSRRGICVSTIQLKPFASEAEESPHRKYMGSEGFCPLEIDIKKHSSLGSAQNPNANVPDQKLPSEIQMRVIPASPQSGEARTQEFPSTKNFFNTDRFTSALYPFEASSLE